MSGCPQTFGLVSCFHPPKEAANQTIWLSDIFGFVSREGKKKKIRGSVIQSASDGDTGDTEVCLCEDEAGLVVNLENLLDGVDVCCRPQIQAQVVLVCCPHDLLGG